MTVVNDAAKTSFAHKQPRPRLELAPETLPFDFLESKVRVPSIRAGSVSRTALVNRLRAASSIPVATVVAPAGYGKTTLLSQWTARDPRPFAWVSIDERDNDPVVLLRHIAAALSESKPLPGLLVDALRSPGPSIWSAAIPRLSAELRARGPLVLVLDDFSQLRARPALETVAALVDDDAEGSTIALSGRTPPRIALAALRARGRLFELGVDELALTDREAELLLRGTGIELSESASAKLVDLCEGWAAALYLAALAVPDDNSNGQGPNRGDDRYLADYLRSEYLAHLRPGQLRFLRRASVLDRMSGPLCDAVLDGEGSTQKLEKLERANLFLLPLDDRREWYRYHQLFGEVLRHELVVQEPNLVPVLHQRAADWFAAQGDRESELDHAYAGGNTDRAATIVSEIGMSLYYSGRVETLERWFERFQLDCLLERYPSVALLGSGVHLMRGRREEATRWLETARGGGNTRPMPDGSPSLRPWIAVIRAWMCSAGARQMLVDAEDALADLPAASNWRPAALLARASALHLLGDDERADEAFSAAISAATSCGADEAGVIALSSRALLLADQGDYEAAEEMSNRARRLVTSMGGFGYPARSIERAASARMLLRNGHWNEARADLTAAQELLTDAVPWLAIRTRLEVAHGLLTLRDGEATRKLLGEVEDLCGEYPGMGVLQVLAEDLRGELDTLPEPDVSASSGLTPAELRLLPLLATHLSFREIAEELHLSRNTVKTQAISMYRKLGASSRSDAIAEALRLGLGEHLRVVVERS